MKRCLRCETLFEGSGWQCPGCGSSPEKRARVWHFPCATDGSAAGYQPEWFGELARLEAGNFWFQARNRLIGWLARRYLPVGARFLEIGCGTGYVVAMLCRQFPKWRISASEVFPEAFPFVATRVPGTVELEQFDARAIPYRDEFDAVGAFDVIEHIRDDAGTLREIHAALKPQGFLVASVPQHKFLWSRYDELGCHFRRYEKAEFDALLAGAGFRVVDSTAFMSLLLPLMWISRKTRRISTDADLLDELRIGRVTNAVLAGILAVEFMLVRLGIRWPMGGSRIVVAQKV